MQILILLERVRLSPPVCLAKLTAFWLYLRILCTLSYILSARNYSFKLLVSPSAIMSYENHAPSKCQLYNTAASRIFFINKEKFILFVYLKSSNCLSRTYMILRRNRQQTNCHKVHLLLLGAPGDLRSCGSHRYNPQLFYVSSIFSSGHLMVI